MAIGRLSIHVHTRSKGHSAAAALAYRAGLALTDSRTGVRHDFRRRGRREEIAAAGITAGRVTRPLDERTAQALADHIETGERRRNACILRDYVLALPYELDDARREAVVQRFARELSGRHRTVAAWAIHRPDRRGDSRNHHAHVSTATRDVDGRKIRALDDRRTGPDEVRAIRALWGRIVNDTLHDAGIEARVSLARREDGSPVPTLGPAATAIERRRREAEDGEAPTGLSVDAMLADGRAWTGRARQRQRRAGLEGPTLRAGNVNDKPQETSMLPETASRTVEHHPDLPAPVPPPAVRRRPARARRRTQAAPLTPEAPPEEAPAPSPPPTRARRPRRTPRGTIEDRVQVSPVTETPAPAPPPRRRRRRRRARPEAPPMRSPATVPQVAAPDPTGRDGPAQIARLDARETRIAAKREATAELVDLARERERIKAARTRIEGQATTPRPAIAAWEDVDGRAPTPEEEETARRWMRERTRPGRLTLAEAADAHVRDALAGTAKTDAATAIGPSAIAGAHVADPSRPADSANRGAMRSRDGARAAARVLEKAIADIAAMRPPMLARLDPAAWRLKQWRERAARSIARMVLAALSHEIAALRQSREARARREAERKRKRDRARERVEQSRERRPRRGRRRGD